MGMKPPNKRVEPKSRERLWHETLVGIVLFVFGVGIVGGYVWHQLSPEHNGHDAEVTLLAVGVCGIVAGLWWMNRKLTREFVGDIMSWAKFWKSKESDE